MIVFAQVLESADQLVGFGIGARRSLGFCTGAERLIVGLKGAKKEYRLLFDTCSFLTVTGTGAGLITTIFLPDVPKVSITQTCGAARMYKQIEIFYSSWPQNSRGGESPTSPIVSSSPRVGIPSSSQHSLLVPCE